MPITVFPPAIYCVSWFAVESIASFPSFTSSHAQPDPNRPRPAALNFSLNPANEPKLELIAAAKSPFGSPPPPFFINSQNSEWFQWPPPLLRTAARIFSGTLSRVFRMCFQGLVEIGDVGAMMLVVMDFHRSSVNIRFKCVVRVRQGGHCKGHG